MITHITVEDAAKLISRLTNANEMQALTYIREAADRGEIQTADALEKLQAENAQLRAELEQVKAGRDAAIEYLREIEWCAGCKHFGGLDGCKKWAMGQCTEKHDLYEFIGPQKEG